MTILFGTLTQSLETVNNVNIYNIVDTFIALKLPVSHKPKLAGPTVFVYI